MILQVPEGIPYRGRGHWAIAVLVILCVATIAIVGLRLYSRHKILKQSIFGWMDWCIIVSTVSMLAFNALQLFSSEAAHDATYSYAFEFLLSASLTLSLSSVIVLNYGVGVHQVDLPKLFTNDHDYLGALIAIWRAIQMAFIQRFLYDFSTCFIKLSILLFLYTLSPYRSFHFLISILIFLDVVIVLISTTVTAFHFFAKCAAFRSPDLGPSGFHCSHGWVIAAEVLSICNATLDAICWLIPMHFAWQVSNRWKERFRVAVVLCMGFTAVIASVVRILIINWLLESGDGIWYYLDIGFWAMAELVLGIICACCPALIPIIRLINRKIRGPASAQRSGQTIAAIRRDLESIEVGLHSGPDIRKIGHTSATTNSNHENMLGIGTPQHQNGGSFHAVGISGRAYCASTAAFANTGSTGGSLGRISTVAPSLETVDANSNHERSMADIELGSGSGGGRRGDPDPGVGWYSVELTSYNY